LRDETVVVDAGISVPPSLGFCIDLCRSVLRINDWMGLPSGSSGFRTTHVLLNKDIRGGQAGSVLTMMPSQNILLAGFGESTTSIDTRLQTDGIGLQLSRNKLTLLQDYFYFHTELNDEVGVPRNKHVLSGTIGVAWALRNTAERPIFVVGLDLAWQREKNITALEALQGKEVLSQQVPRSVGRHQMAAYARGQGRNSSVGHGPARQVLKRDRSVPRFLRLK
jgi:hypothetical protein